MERGEWGGGLGGVNVCLSVIQTCYYVCLADGV